MGSYEERSRTKGAEEHEVDKSEKGGEESHKISVKRTKRRISNT